MVTAMLLTLGPALAAAATGLWSWTRWAGACRCAGPRVRRPHRHGRLVFFAEFPTATGVFERLVSACPLAHRSGNAPDKHGLLGPLAGHRRDAHITALRCDVVAAAHAMSMNKVVSEDVLRRALERIDEPAGTAWVRRR